MIFFVALKNKLSIMENLGYVLLGIVGVLWLVAILIGFVAAFPFGLIGFVALGGFILLFVKVIKDRMDNEEDDYYSKNIDK